MRTEPEKKLLASIKTVGTFTWEGAMRIKEVFEKVRPYLWWKGVDELSAAIHAVESGRLDVAESIARGRGLRHVSGATKNLKNAVLSIQTDRKNGNNNEGTHLYDALKLHKKEHKMSEEQIIALSGISRDVLEARRAMGAAGSACAVGRKSPGDYGLS